MVIAKHTPKGGKVTCEGGPGVSGEDRLVWLVTLISKVSTFSYVLFCLPGISRGARAELLWLPALLSDWGMMSSRDAHLPVDPPPPPPYHLSDSAGERVRGTTTLSLISGSSPALTSLMVFERLTTSLISAISLSLRAHSSPLLPTDPGLPPVLPPAPTLLLLFLLKLGEGPVE